MIIATVCCVIALAAWAYAASPPASWMIWVFFFVAMAITGGLLESIRTAVELAVVTSIISVSAGIAWFLHRETPASCGPLFLALLCLFEAVLSWWETAKGHSPS